MDTGVDTVAKRNVERQLAQLSVDRKAVGIRARVNVERPPIRARHVDVTSRGCQQRPDVLVTIKKEFERSNTGSANCTVAGRIARMSRRTFRKRLWQKVDAIDALCFPHNLRIQDILV